MGMLVLTRNKDERIMIGDSIVVTVVEIRGDQVRLGIEAPSSVPVHRDEIYERIQKETKPRLCTWVSTVELTDGRKLAFGVTASDITQARKLSREALFGRKLQANRLTNDCMGPVFEASTEIALDAFRSRLRADGYTFVDAELLEAAP